MYQALRLNVHSHVLALDGVYVREEPSAPLVFHPLPAPTVDEVTDVTKRTALRVKKILERHGRSPTSWVSMCTRGRHPGARSRSPRALPLRLSPADRTERLEEHPSGKLRYAFKKPWKDGTVALLLEPLDLIARACALVPPPRLHMVRYHGVLSSHAKARSEVVPRPGVATSPARARPVA